MRLPPIVRGCRAATTFLTRVPVGGFPYSEADWRWSTAHFPLVGAAIGALMALLAVVVAPQLGPLPAAVIVLAVSMLITGGFHEDGLADTADALGGGYRRERVFEILKDSRIGAFGALALIASQLLRVLLVARLIELSPWTLVFVQAASRLPPLWLMVALPYVTPADHARSKPVTMAGVAQALVASFWVAVAAQLTIDSGALTRLIAVAAGVTLLLGWRFRVRAGGITGDFLGATQQLVECALLAALVWGRL